MALKDILGGVQSFAKGGAVDDKKDDTEPKADPHKDMTTTVDKTETTKDDKGGTTTTRVTQKEGRLDGNAVQKRALELMKEHPDWDYNKASRMASIGKAEGGFEENDKPEEPAKADADSIIDSFLEENPDLVDTPVEEWPEDAIKMLQETLNGSGVDEPDGALPGEAGDKTSAIESKGAGDIADIGSEPTTDVDNPEQDFDIAELAKLVNAGDKDGAWAMLQTMFGTAPAGEEAASAASSETTDTPTNALDRLSKDSDIPSDQRIKKPANTLGKLLGSLRF